MSSQDKSNIKLPEHFEKGHDEDVWSIFKIMGEFVEGYDKLFKIGPCVSIFGSSRSNPGDTYYELAVETANMVTQHGFGVITGGGPGIMEAANKGAAMGKGKSVGLAITLPHEQGVNEFVDPLYEIDFNYFFARKVMFVKYAQGFIVFPGGFGTLDELFEALTLIQTQKSTRFPIIMMGSEYWDGLLTWVKEEMVSAGTISPGDIDLFHLTDDPKEAVNVICDFYQQHTVGPNF